MAKNASLAKNRLLSSKDARELMAYYLRNSEFFKPWEPLSGPERKQLAYWQEQIAQRMALQLDRRAFYWVAEDRYSGEIIAHCSISNVMRGAFQAAYVGYAVDQRYQGKGMAKDLCVDAISFAFNELKLNRLMANYMPRNKRSENLLARLGFVREGYAKRYLKINGNWEDHVMTALVNPGS